MQVQCCVCKKMREGRRWVKPQPPAQLHDTAQPHDISHGYCPECLEQAHREIQAMRYAMRGNLPLAANP